MLTKEQEESDRITNEFVQLVTDPSGPQLRDVEEIARRIGCPVSEAVSLMREVASEKCMHEVLFIDRCEACEALTKAQ